MLKLVLPFLGRKILSSLGSKFKGGSQMGRPSETANRVAFCRAWEAQRPEESRLCYDPIAEHMVRSEVKPFVLTPEGREFFLLKFAKPYILGMLDYIPLRTRTIDDYLLEHAEGELRQLVILGAGYDSRAYRFPQLQEKVKIFEVDTPGTQEDKKAKLSKHLGSLPDYVYFVGLDFEKDELAAGLAKAGFNPNLRTLVICEGVTYFLEAEAVDQTLGFITANTPAGSAVVFDYVLPEVVSGATQNPVMQDIHNFCIEIGEPYKFGLEPQDVEQFLSKRGFTDVENLTVEQCMAKYLAPAHGERNPMREYSIVKATVA